MDASELPSVPDLSQLHARLSTNSRRVEEIVDAQMNGIEQLLSATIAEDWDAVAKASSFLAKQSPNDVGSEVVREAQSVCEELSRAPHGTKKPKHLANLLAACRAARKNV